MKKVLLAGAIAAVAIGGVWRMRSSHEVAADSQGPKLAFDRIWIDHIPKTEQDQIKAFVAITEEPIGIFQQTSRWKGNHELFTYERHNDEVRVLFPQDKSREKWTVSAEECNHDVFDYCLEIKGASRAAKKYYSMKGWEIDGATAHDEAALEAEIETKIAAKLAPLAPTLGQ
jgi:hypothetical protein